MTETRIDREPARLTNGEQRVLEHVLRGETNKEIAGALGCSMKNVEFHISNILKKTGQPSRMRLIVALMQTSTNSAPKST